MTLNEYIDALRERWILIVAACAIAILASCGTWYLKPPEYTADLQLYVSAQTADTTQSAYQGAQLSEQRVASYVELVSSNRVADDVIAQLRLSTTPEQLLKRISVTSKTNSVVLEVKASAPTPEGAAQIANTVGSVFPRLVDELERPSSPTGTAPVAVRVVQPATAPGQPSTTGLPVTLALGLIAGLIVGIGTVLLINAFDRSVRSPEQLSKVTQSPTIGTIAHDATVLKQPLIVQDDPQSPRSEAFRQLRTNLRFLSVDNPQKVLIVTSSLPSEGKSTTVANLAIALASAGQRVLAIEGDLRRPKLAELLGVSRSVGLTSILAGRVRVDQAIQHWYGGQFDVITSGPLPPNPSELLASHHMSSLLADLRQNYDTILIDTPPLLPVTDAAALSPATDGAIIVCKFRTTRTNQVEHAVQALTAVSSPILGTVLTMVPKSGQRAYAQYHNYYRSDQTAVKTGDFYGPDQTSAKNEIVRTRNSERLTPHARDHHRQGKQDERPVRHPAHRNIG